MDLHIGEHVVSAAWDRGNIERIAAKVLKGHTDTDALLILGVQFGRIEGAGHGARTSERHRKAHTLFIAEGNHLDGERQPLARAIELRHSCDGDEHTKIAVVFAGVADSIYV